MNVLLSKPIGYCYGVTNAINIAKNIKNKHQDKNVYIFGLLIHNKEIIPYLESFEIKTIDTSNIDVENRLNKFTSDDVVVFTAHGHKKHYEEILRNNNVTFYDAVCPRVQDNINLILNAKQDIIYIGKSNHPEAEVCKSLSDKLYFYDIKDGFDFNIKLNKPLVLNQTTMSFIEIKHIHEEILSHYQDAEIHNEICDASRLRQENIKLIPKECDLVVIVGDKKSSNSNKLYEVALSLHKDKLVLFVETYKDLLNYDLRNYKNAFITSGTSTPMNLINEVKKYLEDSK